jgi:hypothetical protein
VGFYAQDEWKLKPGFTLSFGLRYDINGALSEQNNIGSNFFPSTGKEVVLGQGISRLYNLDLTDFGPHAGFAWDIFGNGKTALRGGYSMAYDIFNMAAPRCHSPAPALARSPSLTSAHSRRFPSTKLAKVRSPSTIPCPLV